MQKVCSVRVIIQSQKIRFPTVEKRTKTLFPQTKPLYSDEILTSLLEFIETPKLEQSVLLYSLPNGTWPLVFVERKNICVAAIPLADPATKNQSIINQYAYFLRHSSIELLRFLIIINYKNFKSLIFFF